MRLHWQMPFITTHRLGLLHGLYGATPCKHTERRPSSTIHILSQRWLNIKMQVTGQLWLTSSGLCKTTTYCFVFPLQPLDCTSAQDGEQQKPKLFNIKPLHPAWLPRQSSLSFNLRVVKECNNNYCVSMWNKLSITFALSGYCSAVGCRSTCPLLGRFM